VDIYQSDLQLDMDGRCTSIMQEENSGVSKCHHVLGWVCLNLEMSKMLSKYESLKNMITLLMKRIKNNISLK
jgi:hypothetical protein